MVVIEYGGLRKYTCPCCKSVLGYTNKDIYTKEFCDPKEDSGKRERFRSL